MKFLKALSPIQQALVGTLWFGGGMALFRLGYGALDPEFRTWGPVAIAPLFGLSRYVAATGRNPFPPELMIAIGYVGLLVSGETARAPARRPGSRCSIAARKTSGTSGSGSRWTYAGVDRPRDRRRDTRLPSWA